MAPWMTTAASSAAYASLLLASCRLAAAAPSRVFGIAMMAEGALDRLAAVEIAAGGAVTYRASQLAPPSDAFCNVGFSRAAGTFFVPSYTLDRSGRQSILTLDAATGELLHNATTSVAVDVPAMAFDDASKLLYGVGFKGDDGLAHVWSIDPVSGATTEIGKAATQDDIQLCEAAFSPPTAAMPLGALIFLWTPKAEGASDAIVTFDVAQGAVVGNAVHEKGGLNTLSVWTPPGSSAYELLAMSFLNTRPMELLSVAPDTGASRVLLTLPAEGYVPCQGAQAFAEDAGTIWVALGFNDPRNHSFYPVVLEINATATPATMQQHWLDETKAPGGIWALNWVPGT
jgi:hypothetical protein